MGIDQWRDFQSWPPDGYEPRRWHLHAGDALSHMPSTATTTPPTTFTYDPTDPTPTVGGPRLLSTNVGAVDNRRLESREDVLTFTSDPLDADLEVIGEVTAEVWIRADRPVCHLFVRLCDVDKRGRSINICDDIVAVRPQGITKVTVELSPTAHVFRRGHRIRVQISGGSFPRYPRNTGTDDSVPTATTLRKTRIELFHDVAHPSAILLPAK